MARNSLDQHKCCFFRNTDAMHYSDAQRARAAPTPPDRIPADIP